MNVILYRNDTIFNRVKGVLELALSVAQHRIYDIGSFIEAKLLYNSYRLYKHGKKF